MQNSIENFAPSFRFRPHLHSYLSHWSPPGPIELVWPRPIEFNLPPRRSSVGPKMPDDGEGAGGSFYIYIYRSLSLSLL